MGDVAVDLLGEGASVGFDPVFHLFVTAPLPELAGESNGEFLERVLHDVCLTEIRYCIAKSEMLRQKNVVWEHIRIYAPISALRDELEGCFEEAIIEGCQLPGGLQVRTR